MYNYRQTREKIEELAEIMREGNCNAEQCMLASDSQNRAAELMQSAISIIEDLTGEKWEFSYITY